jgi:hypothetical protein
MGVVVQDFHEFDIHVGKHESVILCDTKEELAELIDLLTKDHEGEEVVVCRRSRSEWLRLKQKTDQINLNDAREKSLAQQK